MSKRKKNTADEYLNKVIKRFEAEDFTIKSNVKYKGQVFDHVVKKLRFEFDKFGFIHKYFILSKFSSLDTDTLKAYSAKSFSYTLRTSPMALVRGLFFGCIVCYPVAVVDKIDDETSKFIRRKAPPKPVGAFEMPVVYSLKSGELYYCEIEPYWGVLFIDEMRATVNNMLSP